MMMMRDTAAAMSFFCVPLYARQPEGLERRASKTKVCSNRGVSRGDRVRGQEMDDKSEA